VRQNFFAGDIGKFKSQALAERLSRRYGREILYAVMPFHEKMSYELGGGMYSSLNQEIVIGCLDNAAGRASIAGAFENLFSGWWIDAGNGEHSGQVLIGNDIDGKHLEGMFCGDKVKRLPAPSLQQPSLLIPTPEPVTPADCARAVESNRQSPVINRMMADLALVFVHRLLSGTLSWMGAYIDIEAGTMSAAPATPEAVARLTGISKRKLINTGSKRK
jgi:hypothetical protein